MSVLSKNIEGIIKTIRHKAIVCSLREAMLAGNEYGCSASMSAAHDLISPGLDVQVD